ncbi:MAG: NUDIX hydrolase [Pirellulales bacterium]|nr:NUDIX hydrolase [Pirellulales bacterium]
MHYDASHPISQACAIPYRLQNGHPVFCLITTTKKGKWVFPKGVVDPGETPEETALKEAREEAGLRGRIEGGELGEYTYSKWGADLSVSAYLMRVTRAENRWQEAGVRERRWYRPEEARKKLGRKTLRDLLDVALERISGGDADPR